MEIKLLEIRDRATFLPVYAISTEPSNDAQRYLLRRAGFSMGWMKDAAREEIMRDLSPMLTVEEGDKL